ncbi:MAG: glycosyltransferase, partial [Lachnospiraceae bacterium]|nr:glycosyltransferase [Lachnospiraceae bacterium]
MDNGAALKYEQGIALFEEGRYEEAVACFICAYESDYMQAEILQNIYNCFVIPNIQEFQDNYNVTGVERYGIICEDTVIDFIPVAEYTFYIWHRKQEKFIGLLDVSDMKKPVSKSFQSLFITDRCNIEDMLDLLTQKNWSNVYILLQGQESELLSFCKLPLFFTRYLKDAVFFKSEKELKSYFKNSENYLPHKMCTDNEQYYNALFEEIHNERINEVGEERNNIFLSVCIPTWNRGLLALDAVKNILLLSYDAEIEVVVSNNGSDKTQGYDELKKIKDSRLRYYELDSNMGFAYNFRNVLGKAKGKFVVMCSDEDLLKLDAFPEYLDFLKENDDVRFFTTSGDGQGFKKDESCIYEEGSLSYSEAINANYITGATYNNEYMRKNQILEVYDEMKEQAFIFHYPHCALAVMAVKGGKAGFCNINLWTAKEPEEAQGMLEYMKLEHRIEQQNYAISFFSKIVTDQLEIMDMISIWMYKTYHLLRAGFQGSPEVHMERYNWLDVCLLIYDSQIKLIKEYSWMQEDVKEVLNELAYNNFIEFAMENPVRSFQTEQEAHIQETMSLIIQEKIKQGVLPKDISTFEIEQTIKGCMFEKTEIRKNIMDKDAMHVYEQGIALFEEGRYEEAVACFICTYESGYMQAEILQNIYNCFVIPNIQEFQDNYDVTGVERYGVKCEDTVIDFIPVAEYTFYIWHRKQEKFIGLLDVSDIKKPVSKSFQSLFIEDRCNIEDMLDLLTQKNWNHVYVLLNGEESEILSFCKLPLFFMQYLKDAVFFKSEEELKSYFKNSENYLPHKMCTDNEQYYNTLFE